MEYFSDHMIQHLLLIMVAAPLFALSAPLDLAYDAGSARLRHFLDGKFMTLVTQPLFGFAAYFVFIPVTHLTGLFNLMMEHEWVHHLEQIGFLVVGYLFFRVAFGLERGTTIHRGLRLVFVMAPCRSTRSPASHWRCRHTRPSRLRRDGAARIDHRGDPLQHPLGRRNHVDRR